MDGEIAFSIGASVSCRDGACGDLRRLVVDPIARTVTHLVVEPHHHRFGGRLVPVKLAESADEQEVRLSLTLEQFEKLDPAEEDRFLPGGDGYGYEPRHLMLMPYVSLGMASVIEMGPPATSPRMAHPDRVPTDEVEVRRGDHVYATDGVIGKVRGLAVDPRDHQVTHVLLEEGHLWGKKEVAIPIGAVRYLDGDVRLNLSQSEVEKLPPVELEEQG